MISSCVDTGNLTFCYKVGFYVYCFLYFFVLVICYLNLISNKNYLCDNSHKTKYNDYRVVAQIINLI